MHYLKFQIPVVKGLSTKFRYIIQSTYLMYDFNSTKYVENFRKIFTSNQRLHLKGFCHYRERHHNALWNSLESGLLTTLFHYQSVKIKTLTTIGHLIKWSEILMGVLQLSISLLLSLTGKRITNFAWTSKFTQACVWSNHFIYLPNFRILHKVKILCTKYVENYRKFLLVTEVFMKKIFVEISRKAP